MTMLSSWYFTCCVRAREEDTASFLAILSYLERPPHDERMPLIAVEELRRAEIWMQIYAAPAVMRAATTEGASPALAGAAFGYLVEQLDRLAADEPRRVLMGLVREVIWGSAGPGRLDRLQTVARHLLDWDFPTNPRIPYLDLKDRVGETILLAALRSEEDLVRDLRPLFEEISEEREETPIETLIYRASRGQHGRLALLEATRLLAAVTGEPRRLAEGLWQISGLVPEIEPDLVELSSELSFGSSAEADGDGGRTARTILRETYGFLRLRQLHGQRRFRREDVDRVLKRMGLPWLGTRQLGLTGVLWQTALWRLAARASSSVLVQEAARLWRPCRERLVKKGQEAVFFVRHAGSEPAPQEWALLLSCFLRLRDQTKATFEHVSELRGDFVERWLFPHLFSPWLVDSIYLDERAGEWREKYLRVEDPVVLLRLLETASLACDLLGDVREPESRTPLLELVVHADRVLNFQHGKWLAALARRERLAEDLNRFQSHSLPRPLGGLALFVRRRLQFIGQGHAPEVGPAEFVNLAKIEPSAQPTFWNFALPRALVSWILDAMSEFVQGQPSARWQEHVPYVCQISEDERIPRGDRLLAALLWRYLGNGEAWKWDEFDWRDGEGWLPYRELLLGRPIPWRDWLAFDLDRLKPPKAQALHLSARVALAAEWVAALDEARAEDEALVDAWLTELTKRLWEVSTAKDFDRFLRLRLLELLERPLVLESQVLQRQICLLTLGLGSVFDWLSLLSVLVPRAHQQTGGPALGEARARLLTELPQLLGRRIELSERLQRSRDFLEDPEKILRELRHKEVLRGELARILYATDPRDCERSAADRAEYLRSGEERLEQLAGDRQLQAAAVLQAADGGGRPILSVVEKESWFRTWMIQAALRDPTDDHYTLLYQDYDDYGIGSLFHGKEPKERAGKSRAGRYLGFVVESCKGELGQTSYGLNCGLSEAIEAQGRSGVQLALGEAASVPLEKDRNGAWRAAGKVEALPSRRAHRRRLSWAKVSRLVRERPLVSVQVGGREERFADWHYWDPDLSRAVGRREVVERQVFAEFDEHGGWLPVKNDLLDLIARELHQGSGPAVILTFIERVERGGLTSFLFSRAPGVLYEFPESEFLPDDARDLKARLEEEGNATGLLVALTIAMDSGGRPRLTLHSEPAGDTDLEFPFDDRNLRWRDAFSPGEHYIARFDEEKGSWCIPLESPIGPFEGIEIGDWKVGGRPPKDQASVEVELVDWSPMSQRLASVKANCLPQRRLHRTDGEDDQALLERILSLRRGSQLRLEKSIGSQPSPTGFLSCLSTEGLFISVVAESLTMRPLDARTEPDAYCKNRWVRIFGEPWETPTQLEIATDSLPPGFEGLPSVTGVVQSISSRGAQEIKSFMMLFPSAEGASTCRVAINKLSELKWLNVGSRVTIDLTGDHAVARLENLRLRGEALWEAAEDARPEPGALYLGDVHYRGKARGLCEVADGTGLLRILPEPGQVTHLSTWDGNRWEEIPNLRRPWLARTESTGRQPGSLGGRKQAGLRRVKFLLDAEGGGAVKGVKYLAGLCGGLLEGERHSVEEVRVALRAEAGGELFSVQREFWVRSRRRIAPSVRPRESTRERLAAALERLRQAGERLEAEIATAPKLTARLQDLLQAGWDRRFAEVTVLDSPFVTTDGYPRAGEVMLEQRGDQFVASLRAVPPRDPRAFQYELGIPLDEPEQVGNLYYVGPMEAPEDGVAPDHLFEFGFGLTLRVPEARLLYEGRPFASTEFAIFHGDRVGRITFIERAEGEVEGVLFVDVAELSFSPARQLYRQASEHGLIHTLHLTMNAGRLSIDTIEGFDDRRLADWRSYRVQRAVLAAPSEIMEPEDTTSDVPGLDHLTVFGRLNQERFLSSVGYDVVFNRVRFTFDSPNGLRDNEKLFLWGERIEQTRNDYYVPLMPPPGFDARDIGKDLETGIPLFRREFSARESLLRRLATCGREFEPRIFPVAIRRMQKDGKPRASLLNGSPSRQLRFLWSALSSGAGSRYAVVADPPQSGQPGEIRLEIRPGVFFTIGPEAIEQMPSQLFRGAVLRLEQGGGGRFALHRCSWGDERYLRGGYRAVVLLPLNTLLRQEAIAESFDNAWWSRSAAARFTVGGLPNIIASPRYFDKTENVWNYVKARPMRDLMAMPHPKIGWLARVDDRFVAAPDWGAAPAGRLNFERAAEEVWFEPFSTKRKPERVLWSSISFLDAGRKRLEEHCRQRGWYYHDSSTGHWVGDSVTQHALNKHTAVSGPVFAEADEIGSMRLRYSMAALSQLGYPVQHLAEGTTEADLEMPIAAVASEAGRAIGLWVELAPGQIVEMPGELITHEFGGRQVSLARLAWEHFAAGDLVRLRSVESGTPAVDSFELAAWRRGPRAALGSGRSLLPVDSFDYERGELTLGAGAFRLRYPATVGPKAAAVWLSDDNQVQPDSRPYLSAGETVLLGIGDKGDVIVLGTGGYQAIRHRNPRVWRGDQMGGFLYPGGDDRRDSQDRLRRVIDAAGGALPATVEGVDREKNVYFSFRYQQAQLSAGGWAIAIVIGFVARERQLLLRVGSGVVPLRAAEVVQGLPKECAEAAAEALVKSASWIWLNAAPDGRWFPGIGPERQEEGRLDPTCAVSDASTSHGLIARSQLSQRLYWVSAADLARTRLTPAEVKRIWFDGESGAPSRSFLARLRGNVSPLATKEAVDELAQLGMGASLRVVVLSERDSDPPNAYEEPPDDVSSPEGATRRYLVESHATGIVLSCSTKGTLDIDSLESVEVASRTWTARPSVTVMPIGERDHELDAPTWLTSPLPSPGEPRLAFARFLRWRVEAHEQPLDSQGLLEEVDGEELDRRVCHAYEASLRKPLTSAIAGAPVRWLRQRMADNAEVDLAYPLMAVATLGAAAGAGLELLAGPEGHLDEGEAEALIRTWRGEIDRALASLGRRAVRSLHVEVLARRWLGRRDAMGRDSLTVRLTELEARLNAPLTQGDLRWIEQCADFFQLSGEAEWRNLGRALLASLGQCSDLSWVDKSSSVLVRVIRICRFQLPDLEVPAAAPRRFDALPYQVPMMRDLVEEVTTTPLDITLLQPLPRLVFSRG